MVELVDTRVSKTRAERRVGSTPTLGTICFLHHEIRGIFGA